jgi:hypothetical protein
MGHNARKDRPHDGHKSSNRSCGWVVERSFTWLSRTRRLAKDDERKVQNSETLIEVAATRMLLRRVSHRNLAPYRRLCSAACDVCHKTHDVLCRLLLGVEIGVIDPDTPSAAATDGTCGLRDCA